jgi:hypothetical protein
MQVIRLGSRPPLKSRRIPPHRRKITVVKPIQDRLFLLQAGVALSIRGGINRVFTQGELVALLARGLVVLCHEAGADEEDVADLDVASLGGGADVNALGEAAGG